MKSALWLWQIYHIRCTLTRSDPTRPDQAGRGGEGRGEERRQSRTKCWDCRANLGNMVKFQLGASAKRSQQLVGVPARIHCVYTTDTSLSNMFVHLFVRTQVTRSGCWLVGRQFMRRWGVKFFTANCVKISRRKLRAEFDRLRIDVAYGERTKNQFLMTATATTV